MMHTQHRASATGQIAVVAARLLGGLRRFQRAHLFRGLAVVLTLMTTAVVVQPAAAISRDGVATALRSTVQVIVPDNDFEMFSLGSGTVMDANGLILTNNHVVEGESSNGLMNNDALAFIAVPPADLRGEAIIKYFGVIVKTEADLDLALVQIIGLVDDAEAPLPENLGLPAIQMGNSDDLMIGDEINMFGYPGLGGNTPTFTKGTVAGFLDEDRNGVYEWIKTDAELNHGNSGGLSTNEQGHFVGVPTMGNTDEIGKIGLVRSGNIALDFVNGYFPNPQGDGPQVTNVRYAEVINRRGEPINPATQFPSGTTDIYAVFDYSNFADDGDFSYVWYADGLEIARESFAWDGGASGTNWVSTYDDNGLPDGFTELEIFYGGASVYRGGVMIGEGNIVVPVIPGAASFGEVVFATENNNERPSGVNTSFVDVQEIFAFFDFTGMTNGVEWTSRWLYEGQVILETPSTWDAGESGTSWVSIFHPDGLPAGVFELELEVQGELFQTASFTVQDGGRAVTATDVGVIGEVVDRNNARTKISGAFIVFLQPGFTVDEWVDSDFSDTMIHGTANSNSSGEFQLSSRVIPGESYSIVVVHDDYEPIAADDWEIPAETEDPYVLEVSMDGS